MTTTASILIVDDNELFATQLAKKLGRAGYDAAIATRGEVAIEQISRRRFDLILLDLKMPELDGWEILRRVSAGAKPPRVIILSASGELPIAVKAMRAGAADYIEKPCDLREICDRIDQVLRDRRERVVMCPAAVAASCGSAAAGVLARGTPPSGTSATGIVAESAGMKQVLRLAELVAQTHSSPALILGESGVGKEIVASHIHQSSARRDRPCVRVNLAAIPDSMVEAELFGSVKGAFTGASGDRVGLIASADKGTLLLDEFCEFKPALQSKLLRVLEERRFFPVGSDRQRAVDVRLIAATNRDPEQAIAEGALRRDLYYRISTVVIRVPPLRERPEDIAPLARRFAARMATEMRGRSVKLSMGGHAALASYHWPGNVRELKNVVERAVILSDSDVITEQHLRFDSAAPAPRARPANQAAAREVPLELEPVRQRAIESAEREHIERVMVVAKGSHSKAAKLLGVSRTTLWTKLKRYGMSDSGPHEAPRAARTGNEARSFETT